MVEYVFNTRVIGLDNIFQALSDTTRRDILRRVAAAQLSISQIAQDYNLSFAAVSKHIKVLEKAGLIIKSKQGKEQIVSVSPQALSNAYEYLNEYKRLWEVRLDSLENYLKESEE